jgi:hypothetical protein
MIYLSGAVNRRFRERPDAGYMMTPEMGNQPDLSATLWAADNGCFAHPERFDLDRYLTWLTRKDRTRCLFATAPDVVGDAAATLARSVPTFDLIRETGVRAALVGQDGLEGLTVPWDDFDALFLGGSTEWKLSDAARELALEARSRGKWVHMGRVNSLRRCRIADAAGCQSVDGTYVAFGGDTNAAKVIKWLNAINLQPQLV